MRWQYLQTSGKRFFRFPPDAAVKQSWLDNMDIIQPASNDALCSDQFMQTCFSDDSSEVILSDVGPTVFNPATSFSLAVAPESTKQAPKQKQELTTTYLQHPVRGPVTVTLPPSSQLILLPSHSQTNSAHRPSVAPALPHSSSSSSTNVETASVNCAHVEEQPRVYLIDDDDVEVSENPPSRYSRDQHAVFNVMRRKHKLATARRQLVRKKKRFRSLQHRLAALKKVLFSERTLYRDGKKIVEISLSRFAAEVLKDIDIELENGETGEPYKPAGNDIGQNSNSTTNDTLLDDESNSLQIERANTSVS